MKKICLLMFIVFFIGSNAATSFAGESRAYKKALKAELGGDLEKAYSIMKEAYSKNSKDAKTKDEFLNFHNALVKKYIDQANNTPQYDLPSKRCLLIKAQEIAQGQGEVVQELVDVNKEIEIIDNQAKNAIAKNNMLNSCKIFCAIKNYEPYLDSVKQLKSKIEPSGEQINKEINDALGIRDDKDIMGFFAIGRELFPDDKVLKNSLDAFLKEKANTAISISDEYYNAEGRDRLATSVFYLLVARGYSNGVIDLDQKIQKRIGEFVEKYPLYLTMNFSSSFSTSQKEEILSALKQYDDSNVIRETNGHENIEKPGNGGILVLVYLRDLSIKMKPSESVKISKYQAGYQNVPNPVYNQLVVMYNQTQTNAASAAQNYFYNPNFFSGLAKGYAEGQHNAVASQLASTPQYIQEPVYQDYQYQQIDYNYSLHANIEYELADLSTNYTFAKGKTENSKEEIKTAINGAHPNDCNGIVNKQVVDSASGDVLTDFSKENYRELSETIVNTAEKKHLYMARDALQGQQYAKAMNEVLTYRLLKSLKGLRSSGQKNWEIDTILENLHIPNNKEVCAKITSSGNPGVELSIQSMLENSQFSNDSIPDEFDSLKSVVRHVNFDKFQYEKDKPSFQKSMKSIKSGFISGNLGLTNPINMMSQVSITMPLRLAKFVTDKIKIEKRQPKNIIEKCLESVVVIITPDGEGSGFIINKKGYIITNYHVVADQRDIVVKTKDGKKYFADFIDSVKYKDLALLRINTSNIKSLKFGNIKKVLSGDTVYALGSPGGLEQSVTRGAVSAIRLLDAPYNPLTKIEFIQTDAAVNPGNSGGPLINEKGEVIAVNSQKIVATNIEGISFSISIDEVKKSFSKYI